ncbi:MAG: ribose 5-phosphate isomerase B [Chloroflexi bacterium]|nr:ribose 5-phosphate isomerase B [Chloroflexota bacterium]
MKIAIAADHGGFPLKAEIVELLARAGHQPIDLGAHEYIAGDDYPDYALLVGQAVQNGQAARGIVICGSGVGACIAANKLKGIRAGVCHDTYSAHQGVEHDDMNVLCFGARIIGVELAREIVLAFTQATFNTGERYQRRLNKVLQIEREN